MNIHWFLMKKGSYAIRPITWEGWALTFFFCALVAWSLWLNFLLPSQILAKHWAHFFAETLCFFCAFVLLVRQRIAQK